MDLNESIFLDSFILESESLSDEELLESLKHIPEKSYKILQEKVSSTFNGELSKENFEKLKKEVTKFRNYIDYIYEHIQNRSRYVEELKKIDGLRNSAEFFEKKLKDPKTSIALGIVSGSDAGIRSNDVKEDGASDEL